METCKISALALDSVPVRSAVAEGCGSVFRLKMVSVETGYITLEKRN